LRPPFAPMEALSVEEIPTGSGWQYEPKWDGFRCLVFRNGRNVVLQSKAGRPLTRYFPDVVEAVVAIKAETFVLDGEIVVPQNRAFSFDDLLQRIHPAASRVQKLAGETPALLIVFDLLADTAARATPQAGAVRASISQKQAASSIVPRHHQAERGKGMAQGCRRRARWHHRDLDYRSGERSGMQKIKNYRSADCVVGGFRYNEGKRVVGSLLLGLYGGDGLLHHVGFTSTIRSSDKKALTRKLERLVAPPKFTGSAPGGPSRWSTGRSAQWRPLKPKLVVEVQYDHFSGHRFRHGTKLLRWRPDKSPRQCTMDQVAQKKANLTKLLT